MYNINNTTDYFPHDNDLIWHYSEMSVSSLLLITCTVYLSFAVGEFTVEHVTILHFLHPMQFCLICTFAFPDDIKY